MCEKKYLFSVDGGGTKTEFCLYDIRSGRKTGMIFGSSNYKNVGLEIATANLKDSFYKICSLQNIEMDEILGIVIGVSGCDTQQDYEIYKSIAKRMLVDKDRIYICNDSELVFMSVATPPGLCVISGTGSIAVGFDRKGRSYRCGGWGSPLSDQGSGYWIGEQLLTAWVRHCDGQLPDDEIFQKTAEFYHLGKKNEIPYIVSGFNHTEIASVARLASDEAERGNRLCERIVKAAACEAADMAAAVCGKMDLSGDERLDMVVSGSIFNGWLYLETFKTHLRSKSGNPNIHYVSFTESPAQAGISLAKKKFLND